MPSKEEILQHYDFSGWATKNDLKCADGRTIRRDAFKDCDGKIVPLVWMHGHGNVENVLGHALLMNKNEGVRAFGMFNKTESGLHAKECVKNGDIDAMSIFANNLSQDKARNVFHGVIREVSLVLSGANPGAFIDDVVCHGDDETECAILYSGDELILHSDESDDEFVEHSEGEPEEKTKEQETEPAKKERTVGEVFNDMTEEQQACVYQLVEEALKGDSEDNDTSSKEEDNMKHNVFEGAVDNNTEVISHADVEAIIKAAKKNGSLKEAVDEYCLAHAVTDESGNTVTYGIANIDYLFPDAKTVSNEPDFIKREMDWVQKVNARTHHTPFTRVKSIHANITMDEARAKGYIKGNEKTEEVFALLKRSTDPQTIYKKQKLDRDDILDIKDLNVVAWIKKEMRMMLDEEIARAILVGDQRSSADDDKISPLHIRPIWTDDDLYTIHKTVTFPTNPTDDQKAKAVMRAAVKSRKDYKGSGNTTLFTTEDWLTDMLLTEDNTGRIIYDSEAKLATALRVKEIVTVPVLEGLSRTVSGSEKDLIGIIVDLKDYNVGTDAGGEISMFDDFDIDFNQYKYLIETRISGALVKPYSAIVLECAHQGE